MHPDDRGFLALIPVKSPTIGKSRLDGAADRQALARAIAIDTIRAARDATAVRRVLVITDDDFSDDAAALGVEILPDPGRGLNGALSAGADLGTATWPELQPCALLADLPALTPAALDTALATVAGAAAYCSDAEGTGTTLYTAPYAVFVPCFGVGSAAAHAAGGASAIEGDLPGLRRDVDDVESLGVARVLGVGPATAAILGDTGK